MQRGSVSARQHGRVIVVDVAYAVVAFFAQRLSRTCRVTDVLPAARLPRSPLQRHCAYAVVALGFGFWLATGSV